MAVEFWPNLRKNWSNYGTKEIIVLTLYFISISSRIQIINWRIWAVKRNLASYRRNSKRNTILIMSKCSKVPIHINPWSCWTTFSRSCCTFYKQDKHLKNLLKYTILYFLTYRLSDVIKHKLYLLTSTSLFITSIRAIRYIIASIC